MSDPQIDRRLKSGPDLVSANFIIPYPPGFPIMVRGQVIARETIDFMRKLDVKKTHGYDAAEGLKLVRADALAKLSLAAGYYFGSFTYKGLGLGAITATLIAAVIIVQLGITISGPLKPTFFLMFLFAIGHGAGPQLVRGIAKDGVQQTLFAAVVCVSCLLSAYVGLYAGSQTISASMGLATDAINRLGLSPEETKKLLDRMPVAYAVTSPGPRTRTMIPTWHPIRASQPPAAASRNGTIFDAACQHARHSTAW